MQAWEIVITTTYMVMKMLNYAEGFIKNLADLRKPLRRLTSEKNKFVFTKEHEEQIKFIKSQCIDLPKLKLPLDNDDLILETDSSDSTWAAVLKGFKIILKNYAGIPLEHFPLQKKDII